MDTKQNAQNPLLLTDFGLADRKAVDFASQLQSDRGSHAFVRKQVAKCKSPEFAERAELEFLQFSVLLHVTDQSLSPSDVIDEYWHQFILFTKAYHVWCEKHFGRYIHHQPMPRVELAKCGIPERSRSLYRTYFGEYGQMAGCGNGADCFGDCTVH